MTEKSIRGHWLYSEEDAFWDELGDEEKSEEELLEEGYEVIGTITRDTTQEELDQIAHDIADKITPPKDDPIWSELSTYIYQHMEPRLRAHCVLGTRKDVADFEERLAKHVANGGNEREFCYAVIDRLKGAPGWEMEEGARAVDLSGTSDDEADDGQEGEGDGDD